MNEKEKYECLLKEAEITLKLIGRGYTIGNFGFVYDGNERIAEIRRTWKAILVPDNPKQEGRENISKLKQILDEEHIPYYPSFNSPIH